MELAFTLWIAILFYCSILETGTVQLSNYQWLRTDQITSHTIMGEVRMLVGLDSPKDSDVRTEQPYHVVPIGNSMKISDTPKIWCMSNMHTKQI